MNKNICTQIFWKAFHYYTYNQCRTSECATQLISQTIIVTCVALLYNVLYDQLVFEKLWVCIKSVVQRSSTYLYDRLERVWAFCSTEFSISIYDIIWKSLYNMIKYYYINMNILYSYCYMIKYNHIILMIILMMADIR